MSTRWPQIPAIPHSGVTNAGAKCTNRVIKTIARDGYGFRSPDDQRIRTRCAATRGARGRRHMLSAMMNA